MASHKTTDPAPLKQKVLIYVRVSTHWQVDKDSLSVQKRELIAYSEMILGINDYVIFEDAGFSAKNTDRPAYQEMMARLRTGEFSHLLVWKIDRISRNMLDFANLYEELQRLGVTFISKNEQFDTSTAMGEAMLKIILVFAELERKTTAERVTAVMLSRASNGQWNGGRVPFGYEYDKETGEFHFRDDEIRLYYKILDLYEDSNSLTNVARVLNRNGYQTRSGNQWSANALYGILTNPWYIGSYRYNVHDDGVGTHERGEDEWIIVPAHHEPAIDESRFERIKAIMRKNSKLTRRTIDNAVRSNIHPFAGMVKCGKCGNLYYASLGTTRAAGTRPSAYNCSMRRKTDVNCTNKYISDFVLCPFVFNFMSNLLRCKGSITDETKLSSLQAKLLSGVDFVHVKSIDNESLTAIRGLLASGYSGIEFQESAKNVGRSDTTSDVSALESKGKKLQNALSRLKALYLYGENDMNEAEYYAERSNIISEIEDNERRLAEIAAAGLDTRAQEDEFIRKSSYFIMVKTLMDSRHVSYNETIAPLDKTIPRAFLKSTIDHVTVLDGAVTEIAFLNGITCKFEYENKETGPS